MIDAMIANGTSLDDVRVSSARVNTTDTRRLKGMRVCVCVTTQVRTIRAKFSLPFTPFRTFDKSAWNESCLGTSTKRTMQELVV